MNKYSFDEIEIGKREVFSTEITEAMLASFRLITGDINRLHSDETFAKSKNFRGGVVSFGMLTASFMSTLAGVYLPGELSLIHSVEASFRKPVYIGDSLIVSGTVKEKNDTFKYIIIDVEMRNQRDERVLKGKMRVGFLDE